MITIFFIKILVMVISGIFLFLPVVTISSIPLVGDFISTNLSLAVGYWNSIMSTFPYAQVAWDILLFVIIPFEFAMMIGKFFLGHRMPGNNIT